MTHENFRNLLLLASVMGYGKVMTSEEKLKHVRVQWDPERSVSSKTLPYRSIQIGITGEVRRKWVENWIAEIEDVTEMARNLKRVIDMGKIEDVGTVELVGRGNIPEERVYEIDEEIRVILEMDTNQVLL
ncbi:MAG: hypothetical protein Q9219_004945 [cf. Caloplaca sp. 3 TL-2023]